MSSAFFGLDTALRALRTQQTLVDIANQNVANANTEGYSRQVASLRATAPFPTPAFNALGTAGQLGTGVEVVDVSRVRDTFVDYQMRNQLTAQGAWNGEADAMKQVEAIFNEPSGSGLGAVLNKFWSGWQEVANSPSDKAVRANIIEQARAVVEAFRRMSSQLKTLQSDLDSQVALTVTDVNSLAHRIANINTQIARVETSGMKANDLRDQRDKMLDDLSKLVKVNYAEASDSQLTVYVGSRPLVDRDRVNELETAASDPSAPGYKGFLEVRWADTGAAVSVVDGKLKGLIDARGRNETGTTLDALGLVGKRLYDLNALAERLVDSVNVLHASGVGIGASEGQNFFAAGASGDEAGTFDLDAVLSGDPNLVAAGRRNEDGSVSVGDSRTALAIAALQNNVAILSSSSVIQRTGGGPATPVTITNGVAGPTSANVTVDRISTWGAASGTTYTFQVSGAGIPQVVVNGDTANPITVAVVINGTSVLVDAPQLGLRLALTSDVTIPTGAAGYSQGDVLQGLISGGLTSITTDPSSNTMNDQYGAQLAELGVQSQTAQAQATNQGTLITQLKRQREEASGVSIDEETAHLVAYQHAYQAAARVLSVQDEMLDVLINRTGLAGR